MTRALDTTFGPDVFGRTKRVSVLAAIGMILIALLAGLVVATQSLAATFEHQAVLGARLHGVYPPWAIVEWASRWRDAYPSEFSVAVKRGALASGALLLLALVAVLRRGKSYLHGSAHWASERDIRRVGLLARRWWRRSQEARPGVIVGLWKDARGRLRYLIDRGVGHVLGVAPTRTGKGVGFVVPTLLFWLKSVFVYDMKGELYSLTAGWRHKHAGNRVVRFEPGAPTGTARWNPLAEVRLGTDREVRDAASKAFMLIDPDGKGIFGDHWRSTSYALGAGIVLHSLYKEASQGSQGTLTRMDALLADPERPVDVLLEEMVNYPHLGDEPHPFIRKAAQDQRNRDPREAASVVSTLQTALNLYRDPIIANSTSESDFSVRDLMHHDKPMSLYLVVRPADADRLRPLVRLLVSTMIVQLADELEFEEGRPKATYKHPLLAMLDEFASLKKLSMVEHALSYVAGFGIRFYLLVQDRTQLTSPLAYGEHESITSNCDTQFFLPPGRIETAEYISRLLGDTTQPHKQLSVSGTGWFPKKNYSYQLVKRALLTPGEILSMPGAQHDRWGRVVRGGSLILKAKGCAPIRSPQQPLYFHDPVFSKRAAVPPPKEPIAA
ncbi:MAG: type IV secretory system conjugative DNA transfer family protein [Myxococcales bacterium]|nr:type IV secretory system conjugative DNA transfer family protein [Myxococcales bacterium]